MSFFMIIFLAFEKIRHDDSIRAAERFSLHPSRSRLRLPLLGLPQKLRCHCHHPSDFLFSSGFINCQQAGPKEKQVGKTCEPTEREQASKMRYKVGGLFCSLGCAAYKCSLHFYRDFLLFAYHSEIGFLRTSPSSLKELPKS